MGYYQRLLVDIRRTLPLYIAAAEADYSQQRIRGYPLMNHPFLSMDIHRYMVVGNWLTGQWLVIGWEIVDDVRSLDIGLWKSRICIALWLTIINDSRLFVKVSD